MARMKHVFDYTELALVWAARSQDWGKSIGTGSMYFNGDVIYSYGSHFPIARFVTNSRGEEVILLTNRTWSQTTDQRHVPAVEAALRNHHLPVVRCAYPELGRDTSNLEDFKTDFENALAKHAKARKPELYTMDMAIAVRLAREYCEVMCVPIPAWAALDLGPGVIAADKLFKGLPIKALFSQLGIYPGSRA